MLKTRALVAIVVLPILLAVMLLGGWLFTGFVFAALLVGGDEYMRLLRQGSYHPPEWLIMALIALPVGAVWFERPDWLQPGIAWLLVAAAAYVIWDMERDKHAQSRQPVYDVALAVFGGLYIGWLGSYLIALRMLDEGAYLMIFLYSCVAVSDTAAYFVGKRWGTHKMAPRVSPKKTWEGYIASVITGVLFGALVGGVPNSALLNYAHGALLGLLIGSLGTVGDLAISAIKRQVGAKDSSRLIPGHGGILDRLDSVFVTVVITYYYVTWFVL